MPSPGGLFVNRGSSQHVYQHAKSNSLFLPTRRIKRGTC